MTPEETLFSVVSQTVEMRYLLQLIGVAKRDNI
jgi:hypothetical protein